MVKSINDCFPDEPTFYYFQYISFFISATHLENIAIESGKIWEQEMKKLNPDGALKKIKITQEIHEAQSNMSCDSVSNYLYAHSFELLLKWIIFSKNPRTKKSHKISNFLEDIFSILNDDNLNYDIIKMKKMFRIIDEILIWAGRYPSPNAVAKREKEIREAITVEMPENIKIALKSNYCYANPNGLLDISWLKETVHMLFKTTYIKKILPKPVDF